MQRHRHWGEEVTDAAPIGATLPGGHQPQGLLGSIKRTCTGKHRSAQQAEPPPGDPGACPVLSYYCSTELPGTLVLASIKKDKVLTIKSLQYSHLSIILSCGQDGRRQTVSPFWQKSCFLPSKTRDGNANILKMRLSDCFGPFPSYPQITMVPRSKMAKDTPCKSGETDKRPERSAEREPEPARWTALPSHCLCGARGAPRRRRPCGLNRGHHGLGTGFLAI